MNLFKVEELNKRAEELIDEFGDIDNYDEFCDKCGRSAITFGLFDYLEKEFENPYDKEKEPNMFWRFEESGRWINFFKKIWKYMKKGETNMKPLKEEVETKTFSDKELFDDFKDSIGGRCFNKDSVYRWIYKLTDIKPTTEEVYKIMDGWVKSKWAYKKQNEQTGADFYYFDLKETVNERRKNMNNSKLIKEEYNEEYANINIVNGEFADSATPYMVYIWCGRGYWLDRFLCFAESEYDAINDTINWLWEQGEYDMVFDYDQVTEWVEEWMEDEKAELEELEKTYEEYKDNIGDTIDNKWSEFRQLEKEYERIKEDYEDQKDNYISSEFIANDDYSLFVRSENFGVEEIDEETAQKIVYQSKHEYDEEDKEE